MAVFNRGSGCLWASKAEVHSIPHCSVFSGKKTLNNVSQKDAPTCRLCTSFSLYSHKKYGQNHAARWSRAVNFGWPNGSEGQNDSMLKVGAFSTSDFIRLQDNGDEGFELQTATITCQKPFPFSLLHPNLQVDLVAAVHIADKGYFKALQKQLAAYDRVLYEMVADKDPKQTNKDAKKRWRPPRRSTGGRGRNTSFVAFIQRSISQLLGLHFQLECLDYRRENWFHADLDYKTFHHLQLEQGENLFTFARDLAVISSKAITRSNMVQENLDPWRAKLLWASKAFPMPLFGLLVIEGVCASSESPLREYPEMKALLNLDVPAAIKVFLAKQLSTDFSYNATALVENSVIIGQRNAVAMDELKESLNDGCKRIAIFYGGGHMPDMARRLKEQFGLVPREVHWQTAWHIKGRRITKHVSSVFLNSLAEISGWPLNRYETFALLLFSWVLALDLWFWELCLSALDSYVNQVIIGIGGLLDRAWGL